MELSPKHLTIFVVALCVFTSCGSSTPGGPAMGPGGSVNGQISAVIDGMPWQSDANLAKVDGLGGLKVPGFLSMGGTRIVSATNYTALTLVLGYISGPGTYPLGVNQGTTAGGGAVVTSQSGGGLGIWNTGLSGNAGTITIATLTSTRMTGSFQFNAPPQLGSTVLGNKVVTNGVFDLPVTAGFAPAPANDHGSKVTATLNGTAWNAATVIAMGTGGAFGFTGSTTTYTVTLAPQVVLAAGNSYALGTDVKLSVSQTGTVNAWGGIMGDAGTVAITTLGGNRATGTFSGTLGPIGSTPGALTIADGTFDVKSASP